VQEEKRGIEEGQRIFLAKVLLSSLAFTIRHKLSPLLKLSNSILLKMKISPSYSTKL